jgi:hypothetical protein
MRNNITMIFILCLTLIININSLKAQQSAYSKEVEARIKRVEESLGESIKTSNEPIRLLQRMEEYNVPAVSIGNITGLDNYKGQYGRTIYPDDPERPAIEHKEIQDFNENLHKLLVERGLERNFENNEFEKSNVIVLRNYGF